MACPGFSIHPGCHVGQDGFGFLEGARITLEGGRSADYQHLIEHFASNAQRETEILLRQGVASGVYRADLDVEVAAAFIAGGYDRFARQLVRETKKPDLRSRLRELRWMVIAGAGTGGGWA